ncbi:folylpolyglutamate synthase, mitochondrial isoform X2 [Chrysemys picta bellii]|uniref:folylpolyglutamate synthase, mitochondrial isoform X2 n=1 Tax=Chrysemys picta bellii TaxID=8478 RepID=UPI0032B26E26
MSPLPHRGGPWARRWTGWVALEDAIRTLNTLQTNANYLEQVKRERGDPQVQLEAMKGFLERSGLKVEDLDQLNIIHVTGTKGKGSTCAFTERILRNYGLKTGFYSSPHLVQVRERIRINGQPISKELFSKYFWQVYNRLEETKDPGHASMPAYFRFLTIMAFHVFLQEKVDLAVVEVGIGGAYDCTNIIRKPIVCGVSSLGIDHTSILGDTIEKIAWQKGGIFKPGVPAFTVPQPERPLEVLRERARESPCPLYLCPDLEAFEEDDKALQLGLAGEHQRSNATLALQLSRAWLQQQGYQGTGELKDLQPGAELLGKRPVPLAPAFRPSGSMVQGLQDTEWLGRTQVLQHGAVTWFIDGAHTTSSVQACVRWFRQAALNEEKPVDGSELRVLLFNATGDRDMGALLKLLVPCRFDYAVFCPNFTEVSAVGNAVRCSPLCRPTELQRHPGEHADPLPGEPEEVEPADGGEGGAGPLAVSPHAGGGGGWPAEARPLARPPALRALLRAPSQLQLAGVPLHLSRPAVDHPGQGPALPGTRHQGAPPAPRGGHRRCLAQGSGCHPCAGHGKPAPGGRCLEAARPIALAVAGACGRGLRAALCCLLEYSQAPFTRCSLSLLPPEWDASSSGAGHCTCCWGSPAETFAAAGSTPRTGIGTASVHAPAPGSRAEPLTAAPTAPGHQDSPVQPQATPLPPRSRILSSVPGFGHCPHAGGVTGTFPAGLGGLG